jgi:uncharacterized membrane protein YjjB (DUF3815 family)
MGASVGLALISAACFAVVYQCTWTTAVWAGGLAAAGWAAASALASLPHVAVLPDLVGAAVVGAGGEILAVWRRQPVTLLVVPAIIPFVPGLEAYQSMVAFINHHFQAGLEALSAALLTAAAIAVGLAAASFLVRPLIRRRRNIPAAYPADGGAGRSRDGLDDRMGESARCLDDRRDAARGCSTEEGRRT